MRPIWGVVLCATGLIGPASAASNPRALVESLVACGTRHSLSAWDDPHRGIGCGRDFVVAHLRRLEANNKGRLVVVVDRFETQAPRTGDRAVEMQNVYAVFRGSDSQLAKRAFVLSGHLDSRASDVMDATSDAPGADDDASGVAVALLAAEALAARAPLRATVMLAIVSGEEQGLLGAKRMKSWLEQQGYDVGGMITCDIVGATAGARDKRLRVFSEGGPDGIDSPGRELARRVEELAGRDAVRLIFRRDRFGRGGDHLPFSEAGLPAIRFTEPQEDYRHQHQNVRVENGVTFGDLVQFLDFDFIARTATLATKVLADQAGAPLPPTAVWLGGAVTPSARISVEAASDEQRTGFEILVRETTEPRWRLLRQESAPGETVLDETSTDNEHFAVRAVGKNGTRSLAIPALQKK